MFEAACLWLFRSHLANTLAVLTIGIALGAMFLLCLRRRRKGVPPEALGLAVGLGSLALALSSSYDILIHRPASPASLWGLLTGPALFLLAVLVKLLLIFLAVVLAAGLFKPSRIAEFSAKLFGVELNYKYAKDIVDEAAQSQEKARRQLDLISVLNEAIFMRVAWPFEETLARAEDKAEAVRQIVRDVLADAYDDYSELVRVQVIPFNPGAVDALGSRLAAMIRLGDDEDEDVIVTMRHGAGIAIFHGEHGFGSAIVLEGLKGYGVSSAEICAAGMLYAAASSAAGATLLDSPGGTGV